MNILKEQHARGWLTSQLTTTKHPKFSAPIEVIGSWEFYRTPARNTMISRVPVLRQFSVVEATVQRLKELIPTVQPDILHAHSPVLNALAALRVGRRYNIPVVYEVRAFWEDAAVDHGTARPWGPRYRATRFIETRALRQAHAVITICEGLRQDILTRGIGSAKVVVVPNGVDVQAFSKTQEPDLKLASQLGLSDRVVLGFIGSFYAYEGLDLLLQILPRALTLLPNIKVVLIGGGPDGERLRTMVSALSLNDYVIFTGRVPHQEVPKYYNLIDLLVYPRRSLRLTELVTPLKPLEAMAQGRVVLASDVGGHKELIEDGKTGYLFKSGDAEHLTNRIKELLDDRSSWPRICSAARDFAERERSWQASVARYETAYAKVLGRSIQSRSGATRENQFIP
jgi:PEP-CTERM/exosortase A-associated glycosyltransferase